MIGLVFTDECEGCCVADLELESFDLMGLKKWSIRCIHEDACDRMKRMEAREDDDERDL